MLRFDNENEARKLNRKCFLPCASSGTVRTKILCERAVVGPNCCVLGCKSVASLTLDASCAASLPLMMGVASMHPADLGRRFTLGNSCILSLNKWCITRNIVDLHTGVTQDPGRSKPCGCNALNAPSVTLAFVVSPSSLLPDSLYNVQVSLASLTHAVRTLPGT